MSASKADGVHPANPALAALHRRMAADSLYGHWQPRSLDQVLVPFVWRWSSIYSALIAAGELTSLGGANDAAANRRTVQLVNPGLPERKWTSQTIQMSVQLVRPGERAECHRHAVAALRFIVEGDGSTYTNVEGEAMYMEPGDLVLTPSWTWHDHHNPGQQSAIWLDVHDGPLVTFLDAWYWGDYDKRAGEPAVQPISKPDGYSRLRYSLLRPMQNRPDAGVPYIYKWRDTLRALEAAAADGGDPYDGILLDYANPLTGGSTLPTIGCRAQWLAPGQTTLARSHSASTIYHVMAGSGRTLLASGATSADEEANRPLIWGPQDCFLVPPRRWHRLANASTREPAILFSVTDRPVLEKLGLYREERAEN